MRGSISGASIVIDAGWSAGKDDSIRPALLDFVRADVVANDLGINLAFANAPRDDLGVLRTEIENEDFRVRRCAFSGRFTESVRTCC